MANIYNIVYTALATLGYEVREQGTFSDDDVLPATFITYTLISKGDIRHSDNEPTSNVSRVQVALYSTDPAIKQAADATLFVPMKAAGFLRAGGRDLPFDPVSGHYGYACDYRLHQEEV
jgi:hypothetical protein